MDPGSFLPQYASRRLDRPLHSPNSLTHRFFLRSGQGELPAPDTGAIWDMCVVNVLLAGSMGYLAGLGFGFIFSAMEQAEVDTKLGARAQIAQVYRGTWKRMTSQAKGFSTFGALYMAFDCPLEKHRGKRDIWNAYVSGYLTGSTMALIGHAGLKGAVLGGLSCAGFCGLIEYFLDR